MKKIAALILLLALVGGIVFACLPRPGDSLLLLFDEEQALTLEGALAIAEELDRIADELEMPPVPDSAVELMMVAYEVAPFYQYEGISTKIVIPPVSWQFFRGNANFHVLGSCKVGDSPEVAINIRYYNPYSSFYGKDNLFATLVHELGHAQGIFGWGDQLTEPATQLATVEVLAAMSLARNPWALPALVRELQGYAEDYALSLAFRENRLGEYQQYLYRANPGIQTAAGFWRMMEHWKTDFDSLLYILEAYGETPYKLLVEALNSPDLMTSVLPPLPNDTDRLCVNDIAWAVRHLLALAGAYPEMVAEFEER